MLVYHEYVSFCIHLENNNLLHDHIHILILLNNLKKNDDCKVIELDAIMFFIYDLSKNSKIAPLGILFICLI